jgi:riboflavin kinase/FMN adenylyltransferase
VHSGGSSVVTIGAFDGVHVGHRLVIERVRSLAASEGLRSVVVTFDRHPAAVVRPESAPPLLTDLPQKLELLAATGIDDIEVIRFDEERATETAEDFVTSVLVSQLAVAAVVVGRDFHFGKGRGGNVALLEQMGTEFGFRVVPFDLVVEGSGSGAAEAEVVSSTRIRRYIAAGDLAEAERLLGRPHEVRGVVAESDGAAEGERATAVTIVVPPQILLPPAGRYAVRLGTLEPGSEWQLCEARLGEEPSPPGAVTVAGAGTTWRPGEGVRLLFDRPK